MDAVTGLLDVFDDLGSIDPVDVALVMLAVLAALLVAPIAFVNWPTPRIHNFAGLALRRAGGRAFLHPLDAAARHFSGVTNRSKRDAGLL